MCNGNIVTSAATAVQVRNGYKHYGDGTYVLNNMNITVSQGTIFGILGASGCGKTTLLSCILSLQKLDFGSIHVFGKKGGIIGPLVGYMPQESALYVRFSVYEALWYYGKLYGMEKWEIDKRISFLKSFLQLPKLAKIINTLSGGQSRRVSMALALIHSPKLLVLDEPSVGLDPILRENIWNHLKELVVKEKVTVIVTTHYITESVNCDKVGIMRNGKMIAEDSPKHLMESYEQSGPSHTLEGVVMLLCKKDEFENKNLNGDFKEVKIAKDEVVSDERILGTYRRKMSQEMEALDNDKQSVRKYPSTASMIFTIGCKNLLILRRDLLVLFMLIVIPPLNTFMQETIVGKEPKGLILNYVIGNDSQLVSRNHCNENRESLTCFEDEYFPICNFLRKLEAMDVKMIQAESEMKALSNVQNGAATGYIHFDSQYAKHLQQRLLFRNFANNETVSGAEIGIKLDMSSVITTTWIRSILLHEYVKSMKEIVVECGENEKFVEIPLKFTSLYSDADSMGDYIGFVRPSIVLILMFIVGNFTGAIYVTEKHLGIQNRGVVVGVKFSHQVISSLISDSILLIFQPFVLFLIMSQFFGAVYKGSLLLCVLIAYLSSISGVMFSILLSNFAKDDIQMFNVLLLINSWHVIGTGGLYPLECIPYFWRVACCALPITFPIASLRYVMLYGFGISHPKVLLGILTSLIWICGTGILTIMTHSQEAFIKKKNDVYKRFCLPIIIYFVCIE